MAIIIMSIMMNMTSIMQNLTIMSIVNDMRRAVEGGVALRPISVNLGVAQVQHGGAEVLR